MNQNMLRFLSVSCILLMAGMLSSCSRLVIYTAPPVQAPLLTKQGDMRAALHYYWGGASELYKRQGISQFVYSPVDNVGIGITGVYGKSPGNNGGYLNQKYGDLFIGLYSARENPRKKTGSVTEAYIGYGRGHSENKITVDDFGNDYYQPLFTNGDYTRLFIQFDVGWIQKLFSGKKQAYGFAVTCSRIEYHPESFTLSGQQARYSHLYLEPTMFVRHQIYDKWLFVEAQSGISIFLQGEPFMGERYDAPFFMSGGLRICFDNTD